MSYLAADELAGRATGEPGARLAAIHLARALHEAGFAPAYATDPAEVPPELDPELAGFLQPVPIERAVYDAPPTLRLALINGPPQGLDHGVDFQSVSGLLPEGAFELVRISSGEPARAVGPHAALFLDGDAEEREAWLAAAGAPALVVLAGSKRPGTGGGEPPRARPRLVRAEGDPGRAPSVTLRGPALELVRSGEVTRVLVEESGRSERLEAWNVVGSLGGSGARAVEAVVLSAHYDHVGTRTPRGAGGAEEPDEDLILNGADDDASGCAFVVTLARALAAGPRPERTVVCLLATAEEIGLLGTEHYLDHPAVPLEDTVLNLNFEMVGRPDALVGGAGELWLTGDERSNLGAELRAAGVAVQPDPRPEERFFSRSDNFAFARRGVVAQTLSSYDLHQDYHQPSDELERLDLGHMERAARLAWRAVERVTSGALDPRWHPGGAP